MEEMNQAEIAREETEQKMIMKIFILSQECSSLEEFQEKLKALMK